MRPVVMCLDMVEIARILELRVVPVQLAQPPRTVPPDENRGLPSKAQDLQMDRGISVSDGAEVALEVTDVYRIEPDLANKVKNRGAQRTTSKKSDDGDEESDISLSQLVANEIVFSGKNLL